MDNLLSNHKNDVDEVVSNKVLNSDVIKIKHEGITEILSKKIYQIKETNTSNKVIDFELLTPTRKRKNSDSITDSHFNDGVSSTKKQLDLRNESSESKVINSRVDNENSQLNVKKSRNPPNKISAEMKKMIIDSLESGVLDRKAAATAFNLPYATVVTIYKKFLQTGVVGRKKKDEKIQEDQLQFILDTLAENCTYTIKELTDMIKKKYDLDVHYVSVSKKIPAFHYNLNRIQELPSSDISEETIILHKEYCNSILELQNSGRTIVYFDETEFKVLMRRFCGRIDPVKKNGQSTAPSMRTRHRTIMVSLTKDKVLLYRALEESRTRIDLSQYMTHLISVLKKSRISEAVIVLSQRTSRDCVSVLDLVKTEGHQVVVLPSQNHLFNPVESLFSQWATIVRAQAPQTEVHLETVMATFGGLISGLQCDQFVSRAIDNARDCVAGRLGYR